MSASGDTGSLFAESIVTEGEVKAIKDASNNGGNIRAEGLVYSQWKSIII